ncbi:MULTISPECIES: LysM peptidoglycan-binding domain-containing protein [unclassified Microbacterium]|uniref:muramidase family protein n=1 Tax=unclassified Microbacterium TaxID=2609290 RepID=UPI003869CA9C
MRRNDATPALTGALTAPVIIGSIALSLASPVTPAVASERSDSSPVRADAPERTETPPEEVVVGIPAASSHIRTYTVAYGDTISAIAARHGLRTADVLVWNDLSWRSVIHPGDVLRLGSTPSQPAAAKKAERPRAAAYTVRAGDTLWSIAARHDITVADLAAANDLGASTVIHPGQKLSVTGALRAERSAVQTPSPAPSPAAGATTHTVSAGDTLWAIAARHDVGVTRLLAANGLDASSIIYPGQILRVPGAAAAPAAAAAGREVAPADVVLDAEQIANARTIIDVGRSRGVSDKGIAVALSTAMVESWIRNLDWGDRDSLGLFQQRPSTGWGTPDQVRDPRRAAAAFFGGASDPNGTDTRGLLDISGWESMAFADAAQAVQISAHPDRYGLWETHAYRWLEQYG